MSLYIGDDILGKKVLHITTQTESEDRMRSGILPSTTFHNDKDFLTITLYPVYVHGTQGIRLLDPNSGYYSESYTTFYYSDAVPLLHGAENFILLDANKVEWHPSPQNTDSDYGRQNGSRLEICNCPNATGYPSSYPYLTFWSYYGIVSGLSYIGIFKTTKLIQSSDIDISSTVFRVGSADLYNFKYVYQGNLNDHPACYKINNQLQIIDTSAIEGSVEIQSDDSNTIITKGGYAILSSGGSFIPGSGVLHTYSFTVATHTELLTLAIGTNIGVSFETLHNYIVTMSEGFSLLLDSFFYTNYNVNPHTYQQGSVFLKYDLGKLYVQGIDDYIGSNISLSIEVFPDL